MKVSYLPSPLTQLVEPAGRRPAQVSAKRAIPKKEWAGMRILVTNDDGFDAPGLSVRSTIERGSIH